MTLPKPIFDFFYNEDRAIASLGGAPPEETISSEVGRHRFSNPFADVLYKVLDKIQAKHCEKAEADATILDKAAAKADEKVYGTKP
jgi:hypothetical protein